MTNQYFADFSLALVNRTGAYHVSKDILQALPHYFPQTRYWRLYQHPPTTLTRKIAARAMMAELFAMKDSGVLARSRPGDMPVFYMDPLYVLRAELRPEDIVYCYDVGPVSHPDLFPPRVSDLYKLAYEKIARAKPGLLTVSDFSKREFQRLFGADAARFIVMCKQYIREGVVKGDVEPIEGVATPFLLTVGALEKRKNHVRVIEAYRKSGLYEKGVQYVFCGARGYGADEIMDAARATPGVVALGYVSEQQLRWLFRNAAGMVLPSMLEGFGLPPLEAAQQGLVSMVAAGGAQEEAVGDAGILVNPYSMDEIIEGMHKLLSLTPEDKETMLTKARAHAASMPFESYIDIVDKMLATNSGD